MKAKKDGGADSGTSANHNSKFVCRTGAVHRTCIKHCPRRTGMPQNACMPNAQISVGRQKDRVFETHFLNFNVYKSRITFLVFLLHVGRHGYSI